MVVVGSVWRPTLTQDDAQHWTVLSGVDRDLDLDFDLDLAAFLPELIAGYDERRLCPPRLAGQSSVETAVPACEQRLSSLLLSSTRLGPLLR